MLEMVFHFPDISAHKARTWWGTEIGSYAYRRVGKDKLKTCAARTFAEKRVTYVIKSMTQ